MALGLTPAGLRPSGYRGYINYDEIKSNNKEVTTSFHWELRFTKKPLGVYFPPDRIMAIRLKEVTPPPLTFGGLNEVELHGWKLKQPGLNDYSGDFSGVYQDFVDQSIEYAFRELVYETDRPLDHTARPKADLLWDAELFQLNTQDYPVKKWVILDALLSGFEPTNTMDGTRTVGGTTNITWTAQMVYQVQMNIGVLA